MQRLEKLRNWFAGLSKVDKTFLIALLLRVVYASLETAAGSEFPASGLIRFFFIVAALVFLFRSVPRLLRKLLWRVRHRLLVTWFLVGVVPIVLICALLTEGLFFLMGQVVGYMTATEISRQNELVRGTAQSLAWSLTHRGPSVDARTLAESFVRDSSQTRQAEVGAIVRTAKETFTVPSNGGIQEIPKWSTPDFAGLTRGNGRYYFGAHVTQGDPTNKTEVFLYQHISTDYFKNLLPDVAVVEMARGEARAGGIDIRRTEKKGSRLSVSRSRPNPDPDLTTTPPPGRGWWDFAVTWFVLTPTRDLNTGSAEQSLAIVSSRPSLIIKKLFSTLGNAAAVVFVLMAFTAGALLLVEIISVLFGAKLTRSITRAVADLYQGTLKIQTGDFSHRIPARKTKDQLSELAGSFNVMTERIQHLIVEVKEKERIENELVIARDVQSRLFPKDLPHVKTLELWGGCQPARTVSGDYYDFVSLGSDHVALAIGDISGKGISAALLMAYIQSALRSQFTHRSADVKAAMEADSPSNILSILNDHLYTSSPPEKYATFFLGMYEHSQLIYTNAGHLAPMLVRRGQVTRLGGDGFPVGLFPGIHYDQQTISLEAGDLLVAFTDGVTEAPNRNSEEFGDQRVTELLLRNAERPLDRIAEEIINSVGAWAGDLERHDDTTLVLARRI